MPTVKIAYDPTFQEFSLTESHKDAVLDPEWEVLVDMKASHFRNMRRNQTRYNRDQEALQKFFIQAQMSGTRIREQ